MNERLLKIMEYFNYSPSIFADEIGVIRSSISHIISGRNNPGLELLQKVLIRFPQISSDWLLLGRGEMILSEEEQDKKRMTNVNQPKKTGQLNLDDFTSPRENKTAESMLGQKPNQSNLQHPLFGRTSQEPVQAAPVTANQPENSQAAPDKTQGSVPVESIQIPAKSKSKVKRVTLFFEDNSFQDFVESV